MSGHAPAEAVPRPDEVRPRDQFFTALFEHGGVGIMSNDDQGRFIEVNDTSLEFFGVERKDLLGQTLIGYTHPDDRPRAAEQIRKLIAGEVDSWRWESFFLRKDGEERWGDVSASAIRSPGGRFISGLTVIADITARKRQEAELRKVREAAEAANRAKSAFLAAMSHEIRTPMNAILNTAAFALDGDLSPQQRKHLTVIETAARGLLALINHILDFSKIEAEMLELESVPFELAEVLGEVEQNFRARVGESGVALVVEVSPGVPRTVVGDAHRLRQVLINLVGNAFKFTEQGEVALRLTRGAPCGGPVELRFAVSDTGIGIPAAQQGQLFQAFTQADSSTTRRYGGTGLGLAISLRLARLMGGDLTLESAAGAGSTFTLTARFGESAMQHPARPPSEAPAAQSRPAQARTAGDEFRGLRVLLAGGDETNRFVATELLFRLGFDIDVAADGAQAVAMVSARPYACILMDLEAPGMDGAEAVRRIRGEARAGAPPIIGLTAGPAGGAPPGLGAGIDEAVAKPVDRAVLLEALRRRVGRGPSPAAGPGTGSGPEHGLGAGDAVDLSRCRVLLVDDVQSNLDVLIEALQGHHQLSLALDGESALQSIARSTPDLVLLDLMMPRLDGYEVCRRLRADPATRELPIILLSALAEARSKARGFEAGGTDYITKPFEAVEVRARVRSLLKGKVLQDAARASLAAELRVAQEIQGGMVPKDFARLGAGLPIDVHALLAPAREVGGDLYDVFPLGGGKVCLVLGDVSGKGIPAALFMAVTATLLRATARHVQRPELILSHVNRELARDNPSSMFATLFCAVLDTATGRLAFASGGHTAPALVRPGQPARLLTDRPGTVVGIQADLRFEPGELQLQAGDALVLYTDGVTEAFDPERRCFGEERLLQALGAAPAGAKAMVEAILEAVRAFARGEPQSDDIALLALRWLPGEALDLRLRSTLADAARGYQAVQAFLAGHGVAGEVVHDVALAVEEVLSNLVQHGYAGAEGPISLHLVLDAVAVTVEVRDRGIHFDPRTARPPHLEVPLDERASGDLGIHLVRHAVDRIAYRRDGADNLLTLVRDLNRKPTTE